MAQTVGHMTCHIHKGVAKYIQYRQVYMAVYMCISFACARI